MESQSEFRQDIKREAVVARGGLILIFYSIKKEIFICGGWGGYHCSAHMALEVSHDSRIKVPTVGPY